jgi:hypothetical protein
MRFEPEYLGEMVTSAFGIEENPPKERSASAPKV